MKNTLLFLILFPILIACNDQERRNNANSDSSVKISKPTDTASGNAQEEVLQEMATEQDGAVSDSAIKTENKTATPQLEGEYRRVDSEGNTGPCDCSCIEVTFDRPTEVCISPENIYITVRFKKTGSNSAEIYFENEVQSDALAKEIPWNDFDRNTPIATISIQPDTTLKLDWKGFAINEELALDYAIYGKKTLEGNYIKQ